MSRHLRFAPAGTPHHITHRGNDKQACFRDDRDRLCYLGLVEEASNRTGCDIHAFVLMGNHVHLLVTPSDDEGLSHLMKEVAQKYSQRFNRKYERTGCLWEGRFKSGAVETATYLMRTYRYIEQNPVRAGMVDNPAKYPWSSFPANGGGLPSWLVPHPLYDALGVSPEERAARYRRFVAEEISVHELQEIRAATRAGMPLGSAEFVKRILARGQVPDLTPG
jgi:putative transposase